MNNPHSAKAMEQEQISEQNTVLSGRTQVMALDYKLASILCYTPILLISIVAPIVWLKTEPKANKQLRFHAIQGLAISLTAIGIGVLNGILMGVLVSILGLGVINLWALGSNLLSLAFLAAMVYGIYCVATNKPFKLPVLGDIAEKNA